MAMGYQPAQQGTVNFGWISEAWQLFTANASTWVISTLIMMVIYLAASFGIGMVFGISGAMTAGLAGGHSFGGMPSAAPLALFAMPMYWVMVLVIMTIFAFFFAGLLRMANAQVRGEGIEVGMLFQGGPVFLPVLGVMFVTYLASLIGAIALIVGAFVAVGLLYPAMAIAADGESIKNSLSRSVDAMKSNWLMAAVFVLVIGLVTGLGTIITCYIGALAMIPLQILCMSLAYRDMVGMPGVTAFGSSGMNQFAGQSGQWPPPPGQQQQQNPYASQPPQQNPYASPEQQGQQPPQSSTPYMPYLNQPLAGSPAPETPPSTVFGSQTPTDVPPAEANDDDTTAPPV